jgi:lysophospholipid acyltransferase (LPLAT)-like uncharacterized protein
MSLSTRLAHLLLSRWLASLRPEPMPPITGPAVIGIWHRDLPCAIPLLAHRGIAVMVSRSSDGQLLADLLPPWGYTVYRGSSSSGATAVRPLLQHLQAGGTVAMALDGPRGPALQPQPGTNWLAQRSGAPLLKFDISLHNPIELPTWDRTRLPLPGSRIAARLTPWEG